MAEIKERLRQIDDDRRSTLGRNLLFFRKREKLAQMELSQAVGVTRVTIANIETGVSETSLKTLMKLCKVLDITPNDLLLEREELK